MKSTDIPVKFNTPFAASAAAGNITAPVPATSTGNRAGLDLGFPPGTMMAGGFPYGQDFNGVLNQSTGWDRWLAAGAPVTYDSAFQTAIGGYPQSALVQSVTRPGFFWLSVVDNNTTNPDTGGAGWISGSGGRWLGSKAITATETYVVPAGVYLIALELWGAGGGGQNSASLFYPGGGGGAGEYASDVMQVAPGQSISAIIGTSAGGGASGGYTSFGSVLAYGGLSGVAGTSSQVGNGGAGGSGGTGGSAGILRIAGTPGTTGIIYSNQSVEGGQGGTSFKSPCSLRATGGTVSGFNANNGVFPGGGSTGSTIGTVPGGNGLIILNLFSG